MKSTRACPICRLTDTNNTVLGTSRFRFNFDGGFFASGQQNFGNVPTTGAGVRMMWYPGKWAFRAGNVNSFGSAYWDDSDIGVGSVAFGENTSATNDHAFAAGLATTASGTESVALGNFGTASGARSFAFNGNASGDGAIAAGSGAQATNNDALTLGPSSMSSGLESIAIGPCIASASFSTCIGVQTKATGILSTSLGNRVSSASSDGLTNYSGVISLGDGSATFTSQSMFATANNQFNVRAAGGIRFFTSCCNYDTGLTVPAGGGAWQSISDRNAKENFSPVDSRSILRKLLNLPISSWNYKAQDKSVRHIGAMAQDFYTLFNVGDDDKHISTIDPDGVAFAAIQGLSEELKDRDAKLATQQQQLDTLREQMKGQQAEIDGLKRPVCAQNPSADVCKR